MTEEGTFFLVNRFIFSFVYFFTHWNVCFHNKQTTHNYNDNCFYPISWHIITRRTNKWNINTNNVQTTHTITRTTKMQLSETKPLVCSLTYTHNHLHTRDRNVFHAWQLFCVNCQIVCFHPVFVGTFFRYKFVSKINKTEKNVTYE